MSSPKKIARPPVPVEAPAEPPAKTPASRPAAGAASSSYRLRGIQGQIIEAIATAIIRGDYEPGTKLPRERELIARHGASRTTVREAVKVLEAKGLVETRQRVGTTVQDPRRWNIFDGDVLAWHGAVGVVGPLLEHLVEVRQIVEPAAARLAASRATWHDLRSLTQAFEAMQRAGAASGATSGSYADADVAFHIAVFAASQNVVLQRFAALIADFLRLAFKAMQADPSFYDPEQDLADHRQVLDAISGGDGAGADAAMRRVILTGKASLLKAFPDR